MGHDDSALTTRQFSDRTGISVSAIARLIRQGKLEGYKEAGKWMIPETQLRSPVIKGRADDPTPAAESHPQVEPAPAAGDQNESYYSVVEFSRMTYLTEFGVRDWLKKGKLQGRRETDGSWKVCASNLDLAGLKHLLRK